MKREYPPLYRESRSEARRQGELDKWKESRQVNISCAKNLSGLIDAHGRSGQLEPGTAQTALKDWGICRTQFVLANTLTGTGELGFEPDGFRWARMAFIPPDKDNQKFRIQADRSLLAQFLQQTYGEYLNMGLFSQEHCGMGGDYTGKVLILRPNRLDEGFLSPQNQLWYRQTGFGLSPTSSGRAVFATCLGDGEKVRWNRTDFIGVLDEQYLPDWAAERLAELRGPAQEQDEPLEEQTDSPGQGGMEMR